LFFYRQNGCHSVFKHQASSIKHQANTRSSHCRNYRRCCHYSRPIYVCRLLHKHDTTLATGHTIDIVSRPPIGGLAFFVAVRGDSADSTVFRVLHGLTAIIACEKGGGHASGIRGVQHVHCRRRAHVHALCTICISGEYRTREVSLQVFLEAVHDWLIKMSYDVFIKMEKLLAIIFVHEEEVENRVTDIGDVDAKVFVDGFTGLDGIKE